MDAFNRDDNLQDDTLRDDTLSEEPESPDTFGESVINYDDEMAADDSAMRSSMAAESDTSPDLSDEELNEDYDSF